MATKTLDPKACEPKAKYCCKRSNRSDQVLPNVDVSSNFCRRIVVRVLTLCKTVLVVSFQLSVSAAAPREPCRILFCDAIFASTASNKTVRRHVIHASDDN